MNAEDIAERVRRELEKEGGTMGGPALGKALGSDVRAAYLSLGFDKLSAFVSRHLENQVDVETGGIFRLRSAGSSAPAQDGGLAAQLGGDLFRTWKSPASRYRLRVAPATGHVRQVLAGTPLPDGEKELPALDAHAHAAIGDRFVKEHVPEVLRETFTNEFGAGAKWGDTWKALFATHDRNVPEGQRKWLRFRHDGLIAALRGELTRLAMASKARPQYRILLQVVGYSIR